MFAMDADTHPKNDAVLSIVAPVDDAKQIN
jgi:hypothetical protein